MTGSGMSRNKPKVGKFRDTKYVHKRSEGLAKRSNKGTKTLTGSHVHCV